MIDNMKCCSNPKCYQINPQPLENFCKTKDKSSGYISRCKHCNKLYRQENSIRIQAYRDNHKEKTKIYRAMYYAENKEDLLARCKEYTKRPEIIIKRRANKRRYEKERKARDPKFKLACALRGRLNIAIRNKQKTGSAVEDLGCSVDFLKFYIESKFQPGMTWENHSRKGWHIDHIIPLDFFNLENREEFLKACHYTNLQPLWAMDNHKKSNK